MNTISKVEIVKTKHKNPMSIFNIDLWKRVLHFRGFNTKYNKWIHGIYLPYTTKTCLDFNPNDILQIYPKDQQHFILEINGDTICAAEVEGTSVGIFAQAFDKNNVPIFTGDIVRGINDKLYVVAARIIEDPPVGFPMILFSLISLEDPKEKECSFVNVLNRNEGYTVVGNFYEDKDKYKSFLEYCDIIDFCDMEP